MSEENEFIDWQGGECPVDAETIVEVRLSGGGAVVNRLAGGFDWHRTNYGGDIIAYRVVEAPNPDVKIPEGFTPWAGGECPAAPGAEIDVVLRDGTVGSCVAPDLHWLHRNRWDDIIAYRVIKDKKSKVEIPEGFTPWVGGECPVAPDTDIDFLLQDGATGSCTAASLEWVSNIIAYRVIEDKKPKVEIPEGFTPCPDGLTPLSNELGLRVELLLRNGTRLNGEVFEFDWAHTGDDSDIIAYRLVEAEEKPKVARDTQIGGDHYKKAGVQPWDVVDTWPVEQQVGFYRGNALKYVMRMGTKDENLREIRKAAHYLQKLGEVLEQKGGA